MSSTEIERVARPPPDDAVHDLEIAGPDLELLRRGLEQLARRLGRSLHGLADGVCHLDPPLAPA